MESKNNHDHCVQIREEEPPPPFCLKSLLPFLFHRRSTPSPLPIVSPSLKIVEPCCSRWRMLGSAETADQHVIRSGGDGPGANIFVSTKDIIESFPQSRSTEAWQKSLSSSPGSGGSCVPIMGTVVPMHHRPQRCTPLLSQNQYHSHCTGVRPPVCCHPWPPCSSFRQTQDR